MDLQSTEYRMSQQELAESYRAKMCGRTYRHFKGALYQVDLIAIHSETSELRVIYHSVSNPSLYWDRELNMFLSPVDKVKYPDIKQELRFEPVEG